MDVDPVLYFFPCCINGTTGTNEEFQGTVMQGEVSITGTIVDANDKTPLAGAHVSLVNRRDTTLTFTSMTDRDGAFSIKVPRGRYNLNASFIGYQNFELQGEQSVRAMAEVNDVGALLLKEGAYLDEVEVTGYRSTARLRGRHT
jgi:hypothetical protein